MNEIIRRVFACEYELRELVRLANSCKRDRGLVSYCTRRIAAKAAISREQCFDFASGEGHAEPPGTVDETYGNQLWWERCERFRQSCPHVFGIGLALVPRRPLPYWGIAENRAATGAVADFACHGCTRFFPSEGAAGQIGAAIAKHWLLSSQAVRNHNAFGLHSLVSSSKRVELIESRIAASSSLLFSQTSRQLPRASCRRDGPTDVCWLRPDGLLKRLVRRRAESKTSSA